MAVKTKGLVPRLWRKTKRVLLVLFLLHFVYILLLKWVNPPITITQLGSLISGDGLKRDYIDLEDMSVYSKLAFIAAEDQKFPDHGGFDWKSIGKAMDYNKRNPNKIRGASTISQQVAKNVFLWQGRSNFRKGLEMYFTFMIELVWSKERILEMYMNVSETGEGIFGIEAASQALFRKPAKKLTRREAALIASSLPNPKIYTIAPMSKYVAEKYPRVLRYMASLEKDEDIQKLVQ
ncbi:MAG: monofunctional biosynthetic peptidoglycan transglycosylase [Chitinophagaceae bacterium]|nr:monofunctional biosynthetic peptidoglycan transglycosylase [Chitinophagaceae bacterium]